ncbi:MAG: hypothetical protein IJS93_02835 [Clostridia bacterium]|nr:hypothetical protein [Clostridia bacterium]
MIAEYQEIDVLKELCVDVRIKESDSFALAGVLLTPIASRSKRIEALLKIKEELEKREGKEVLVTADLDIYCRLATDTPLDSIMEELKRRRSYV